MASIVLTIIRCIDYLAYGAIFRCWVFPLEVVGKKNWVFSFPPKKPKMLAGQWWWGKQKTSNQSKVIKKLKIVGTKLWRNAAGFRNPQRNHLIWAKFQIFIWVDAWNLPQPSISKQKRHTQWLAWKHSWTIWLSHILRYLRTESLRESAYYCGYEMKVKYLSCLDRSWCMMPLTFKWRSKFSYEKKEQ